MALMRYGKPLFLLVALLGLGVWGSLLRSPAVALQGKASSLVHQKAAAQTLPAPVAVPVAAPGPLLKDDPVPEFPTATVLAEVIDPRSGGGFERRRLLAVKGPYPLVRVIEHYVSGSTGQFHRERIEAMLADSILLIRPEGMSPDRFSAVLAAHGLRAGAQYLFSPAVRVFVPEPINLDTVAEALARLESEAPTLTATPDFLHFTQTIPNDYDKGQLWGLEKIGAPVAWTAGTGSASLVAATIDSGIDGQHPDLQANLWQNPGELSNGLDDDANGLVDDIHGWDFAANDNNPADEQGHGTHVAGIIGARGNNGTGVTGVNWQVKLLALRCGNENLTTSAVIQALDYLSDLKADGVPIIAVNNSYGSTSSISSQRDSIVRARQQGILFVAAAGNDSRNVDGPLRTYPVCYGVDNIVGVAATNLADGLADYSNWGESSVLLAAPGSAILSTIPGGGYGNKEGTSMAAPFVTGAVLLLKAAEPALDFTGLRARLLTKVAPLPALAGRVISEGRLDLQRLITPLAAVPRVRWEAPVATVVAVEEPGWPVELVAHGYQEVAGDEAGLLPIVWEKTFGPGVVTFQPSVTPGKVVAEFSQNGIYQVRASTSLGMFSAQVAKTVTVGTVTVDSTGLLARWTFEEKDGPALDSSGQGRTATLEDGATRDAGPFEKAALRFNGAMAAASFNAPAPTKVTLAGWINLEGSGNSVFPRLLHFPAYYLFPGCDTLGSADGNRGTVKLLSNWTENDGVYHTAPDLLTYRHWHHLAATYDSTVGEPHLPALYLDGRLLPVAAQAGAAGARDLLPGTGYLGNNAERTRAMDGRIADVRIYGRELHEAEVALLVAEPAVASMAAWELVVVTGSAQAAVLQLRKPDGRVPGSGQTVEWRRIEGPAEATFGTIAGGQVDVAVPAPGNYTVTVGLAEGAAAMERRMVVALPGVIVPPVPPGFVRHPIGRTMAVGALLRLDCEPTGSPPLSYQWLKDGQPLTGAIAQQLVFASVLLSDSARYSVRVSNSAGSATSQDAEVLVLDPPAIIKAPVAQAVAVGSRVELLVEASGSPPLSYQWLYNGNPLPGATSASLVLEKIRADQDGAYSVQVSNSVGSKTSAPVTIDVLEPPSIVAQSRSQTVVSGSTVHLEVSVQGAVPWSFQWFKNEQPIPGATNPSLSFVISKPTDSGDYRMQVTNSVGTASTTIIALRVLELPAITQQPRTQAELQGTRITLEVVATGSPPLKYQWYRGYTILNGQTGAQLVIPSLQPADVNSYTVKVSNEVGSVTSALAYLNILSPPQLLRSPKSGAVAPGNPLTLEVTPDGPITSFSIRWLKDGKALVSASGPQLRLDNVQPEQAGLYVAEVSSSGGTTLSVPAIVGVLPVERTAGSVETRAEWQDIQHPNGNVYDQFLLSGTAGTITADAGQIARMSFLDEDADIVQVELSGAGAVTVCLTGASGPTAPVLYNQTGIGYFQGSATVILAGADATTHLSLYSVGRLNNPGVARADVPYDGWADVRVLGVLSPGGSLGGLHLGNTTFSASAGPTGLVAPSVRSVGTVIFHQLSASREGWPLLYFAPQGQVRLTIAGGDLAQTNDRDIAVLGLAAVSLSAGQGSSGQEAPVQPLRGRLVRDGVDVTDALTSATSPQ